MPSVTEGCLALQVQHKSPSLLPRPQGHCPDSGHGGGMVKQSCKSNRPVFGSIAYHLSATQFDTISPGSLRAYDTMPRKSIFSAWRTEKWELVSCWLPLKRPKKMMLNEQSSLRSARTSR